MSPLRFLFATTHSFLPQRAGGIESSTHELCRALEARGHPVGVMAKLENRGSLAWRNRIRRKLLFGPAFPEDRTPGYPVHRGWSPMAGAPEVARRFDPDVVVVQGSQPIPLVRRFLELGLPTILYLRDVEFGDLGGEIPSDGPLLVLANSNFTARRSNRDLGLEPRVVPPLVRPQTYRTATSGESVVFVNPHPVKGVDIAFELAERRPDIPFLFVESWALRPALRQELRRRASRLENVQWREPVDDMREVYGRARLLLVPSRWEEAWGRVPTEAQLSGIPVLASNRGGLPESVGDGGILLDPDAPVDEWTEALSRVWDDPDVYRNLCRAALAHSRRREVHPDVIVSAFEELARKHGAVEALRES